MDGEEVPAALVFPLRRSWDQAVASGPDLRFQEPKQVLGKLGLEKGCCLAYVLFFLAGAGTFSPGRLPWIHSGPNSPSIPTLSE